MAHMDMRVRLHGRDSIKVTGASADAVLYNGDTMHITDTFMSDFPDGKSYATGGLHFGILMGSAWDRWEAFLDAQREHAPSKQTIWSRIRRRS